MLENNTNLTLLYNSFKPNKNTNSKIAIFHKEELRNIETLKEELRNFSRFHSDFYEKEKGFANDRILIRFYNMKHFSNIKGATCFFVENEENCEKLQKDIMQFLNDYYDVKEYFIARFSKEHLSYGIDREVFNKIDVKNEKEYRPIYDNTIIGFFTSKEEAEKVIIDHIDIALKEFNHEIDLVKEKINKLNEKKIYLKSNLRYIYKK